MKQRILLIAVMIALIGVIATVTTSYAVAAYHGSWNTQPTWGNHWWYNNSPNSSELTWYVDDWWTDTAVSNMQWWKTNLGRDFRIEQEAYKPGNSTDCDRLHAYSYTSLGLPVTSWVNGNGCGSSSVKEELKIELNEGAMSGGVWYRHKVVYKKSWTGCSGSNGEVNYSFSHNQTWADSWLGKIEYNSCFDKTGSDPSGMVN
jgi:hypothetical protein